MQPPGRLDPGAPPFTVLFAGEAPVTSAPSLTLAAALQSQGIRGVFSDAAEAGPSAAWLPLVRRCSAIVLVAYDGPDWLPVRRLARAAALGRPVVRWWVGSDVLYCLRDPAVRRRARCLNAFCQGSVTVAPHLAEELASIGIAARVIPSPIAARIDEPAPAARGRAVLVYLPGKRKEFYRVDLIGKVIAANPDLRFIVVADDTHHFAGWPNVESTGWVERMDALYNRAGCVLRMTEHDGFPRMIAEALLRGKYVIYSGILPGCWHADGFEDVQRHLAEFRRSAAPHDAGRAAIRRMLDPPPEVQFARMLREVAGRRRPAARIRGAAIGAAVALAGRLRRAGGGPAPA